MEASAEEVNGAGAAEDDDVVKIEGEATTADPDDTTAVKQEAAAAADDDDSDDSEDDNINIQIDKQARFLIGFQLRLLRNLLLIHASTNATDDHKQFPFP